MTHQQANYYIKIKTAVPLSSQVLSGLVARIRLSHSRGQGSIPCWGKASLFCLMLSLFIAFFQFWLHPDDVDDTHYPHDTCTARGTDSLEHGDTVVAAGDILGQSAPVIPASLWVLNKFIDANISSFGHGPQPPDEIARLCLREVASMVFAFILEVWRYGAVVEGVSNGSIVR